MLAIVIPYYKRTFFEATLESLANQTDQRFTVYIGDDASTENPAALLEKYKNKVDFKYYCFEENLGINSLTKQWERCITLSGNEEWIMILGDDDVLESNCIECFYRNLEDIQNVNATVVRYATKVINQYGVALSTIYQHPKIEKAAEFLMRKFKGATRSSLSEYVFKKEMVNSIKFKDLPLAWYSDLLAVLEFAQWGNIFTINEAVVYFRLSGINITSKTDDYAIKNVATFQFYYCLLSKFHYRFSKVDIQILFSKIEKTHLDNKKNAKHWLQLFLLYLKFFQVKRFVFLFSKIKNSIK